MATMTTMMMATRMTMKAKALWAATLMMAIGLVMTILAGSGLAAGLEDARSGEVRFHTNTVYTPILYDDLAAWEERRAWLRGQVRLAAGLTPELPRTELNARVFGRLERDGYTVEKVVFESWPGLFVTGNLYRPTGVTGRVPAIACPHGHWSNGRLHHDERGSIPARCITLARMGAVAFAYDMVGYNDSGRQFPHKVELLESPECALWGIGHLAWQTWNSVRVLDFLQSLPDVDPLRLGVTGASGGGTQTFILAAVDDRVQASCPVNMISSTMQGGCHCENAPLLRIDTNNMEIGALFAPRPMLMVSATGDWTTLTPQVEYPFIRGIYGLYGQADRVSNVHVDAEHNYNLASREAMYPFMARHLLGRRDADRVAEGTILQEKPEDLRVFAEGERPAGMASAEELVKSFQRAIRDRMAAYRPISSERYAELSRLVRQNLAYMVGSDWPATPPVAALSFYERSGRKVGYQRLSADGQGDASRPVRVIVSPEGWQAAKNVGALAEGGATAVCVEVFGAGERVPGPALSTVRVEGKFFTTFNRTDAAEAVYDVLTALAGEVRRGGRPMALVGSGRMGPVCLIARAMVPPQVSRATGLRTVIDMAGFRASEDAEYVERLFVPGIWRIGGLEAIAAVAAGAGPLWMHQVDESFDASWAQEAAAMHGFELRVTREPADAAAIAAWLEQGS